MGGTKVREGDAHAARLEESEQGAVHSVAYTACVPHQYSIRQLQAFRWLCSSVVAFATSVTLIIALAVKTKVASAIVALLANRVRKQ
eukprot:IDg2992t1